LVIAYSDPTFGHLGTIYQATNWLYTGLSSATGLYVSAMAPAPLASLAHQLGSHSIHYLMSQGINAKIIPQQAKHRYIYFLDESMEVTIGNAGTDISKKEIEINGNS